MIASSESRAPKIRCTQSLASTEFNRLVAARIIEVGQQFKLDDGVRGQTLRSPSPTLLAVWLELSIPKSLLKTNCVNRATFDLKIYLHVYVDRSRMLNCTFPTQQFRHKSSYDHKLGASAVMVYHAYQSAFG